ncbi:serine hydrolase [Salinifilum ghardaiensis]
MRLTGSEQRSARRGGRSALPAVLGVLALLLPALVLPGADSTTGRTGPAGATRSAAVETARATGQARQAVRAVEAWNAEHPGREVHAAVWDGETGEFAAGRGADRPVHSASLVKLFVVVDVLRRSHDGLAVSEHERRWMRRALAASDDEAMNALWSRYDGRGAVRRVTRAAHLTDTRPPADPAQWGETLVSARDMTRLYRYVVRALPSADREFVLRSVAARPGIAASGFDQGFGLARVRGAAVKQGWMCCVDGAIEVHSSGMLEQRGRFAVTLLSRQPSSDGYDAARQRLDRVAERVDAALP